MFMRTRSASRFLRSSSGANVATQYTLAWDCSRFRAAVIFCVLKTKGGGGGAGIDGALLVTGLAICFAMVFGVTFARGLGAGGRFTRMGLLEAGGLVGIGAVPVGVVVVGVAATCANASAIVGIGPDVRSTAAPAGARVVL